MGQKHFTQSYEGRMEVLCAYYTHLSSWMCSSQQEGGVCSQTKFSSHPQKKGQVQRSASFWNCVIYAWHTLNMILSLYSKDSSSSSFLFTEIPGSSSWNSAQKFISYMLFHTWFPKNTIRDETKLSSTVDSQKNKLTETCKQSKTVDFCKNIWLITTSVDTLMIVVIYNVTGWRRIYICQGGFLGKVKWVDRILPSFLHHFYCS